VDLVTPHLKGRKHIKGGREHAEKNILTYDRGINRRLRKKVIGET
jgi:hypothetical protein